MSYIYDKNGKSVEASDETRIKRLKKQNAKHLKALEEHHMDFYTARKSPENATGERLVVSQ